ncbi:TRAP transporter substrate-binding protein [Oceanimonas baumannii]|uniref:C4-dicarboxylate ABC transporter substrate-binding protein n=1 Tax=Oceanimonas baumannii TaxID=129578 RepID=A0A235CM31_9GAMM|nr:TRAP transporter substrate-binding protein [Oceanimonas baumannii]OYD25612.1 C4-dicarboxylate ABC transporter substrate-binding protein [Oceanimonas baumannii]TDW61175.1 tripartite ATP-independent transporter DctP family solute receptor [Oceanimonas baumannii]
MIFKQRFVKSLSLALCFGAAMASPQLLAKTFRVAVGDGAGGTQHELGKSFSEELKQRTEGKHDTQLFLNGQLGDEQATVNDASMGLLDFSILAINNITPFSPSVGVLTLPYMVQSLDDAVTLTQGEVGQQLVDNTIRDAGVRIVGWAYSGFRVLTNSKQPVSSLADLEGLKIRVPNNEIMIDTYRAWGINPTPMAWSETFTGLQMGVVDGQDNPYITVSAMKFDEVQKYITNIRYLFSIEPLVMSEAVFQEQPEDVQQAILAAGKAATEHSAEWLVAQEDRIKAELVENGMEITEPANGEQEWIDKAVSQVWPKYYDQLGGKEKLNQILQSLGRDTI